MKISNLCIKNVSRKKLLHINLVYELNFEKHLGDICLEGSKHTCC